VALYYTFKELQHLIRSQDFWFHFGFIRTSVIKQVQGGYGALAKSVFNLFINDVESIVRVGIAIDVGAGPQLLYAVPWRVLADGAALTAIFDSIGASGSKACTECANAIKDVTFDVDDAAEFVPISCADPTKFVKHTKESIWESVEDVCKLSTRFNKTRMMRISQCYGFKANPHGLLMAKRLRPFLDPVGLFTSDWPHIFAQNGVGNIQLFHLFDSTGLTVEELRADVTTWTLPSCRKKLKNGARQVFRTTRRDTKKKAWKCQISEFLTVAPMVLNFVLTIATLATLEEVELFVL
jgi:hypothetical protein